MELAEFTGVIQNINVHTLTLKNMKTLLFASLILLASCSTEESDPKPEVYSTCAELKEQVRATQKAVSDHRLKTNQDSKWAEELKVLEKEAIYKINELTRRKC